MKIGVKTFDSEGFLNYFKKSADFFEIMAIQGNDYSFLKKFSLPFVIHAEHHTFGVNYSNKNNRDFNLKSINFARKLADFVKAEKIIVHPVSINLVNRYNSEEVAISFIRDLNEDRILIENLYGHSSRIPLYQSPDGIERFMKETNVGFCFDINHAINYALICEKDIDKLVKDFIDLKPKHYHIGGHKITEMNLHVCFSDSDINLMKFLKYYPKDAEITLETEPEIRKTEKDIKLIKKTISKLEESVL